MRTKTTSAVKNAAGFTLMELMITILIVSILTMVALGSYRNQVVRSDRAAAQGFLLELANRQERYLLDNRSYAIGTDAVKNLTGSATLPAEVADNYTVTIADLDEDNNTPDYEITATAKGSQDTDDTDCGDLTLDSEGVKGTEHGGSRCWN